MKPIPQSKPFDPPRVIDSFRSFGAAADTAQALCEGLRNASGLDDADRAALLATASQLWRDLQQVEGEFRRAAVLGLLCATDRESFDAPVGGH